MDEQNMDVPFPPALIELYQRTWPTPVAMLLPSKLLVAITTVLTVFLLSIESNKSILVITGIFGVVALFEFLGIAIFSLFLLSREGRRYLNFLILAVESQTNMHLYNFTLQGQTAINQSVHGNFSGIPKSQEIVLGRGSAIELVQIDSISGKLKTLAHIEIFGVIRSLLAFRLTGGTKDYVAIGSDSGRIVILEYKPEKSAFERIHQETYGKTGCRRIVPGHYLAIDPKGRAIMIGAAERQKLVYIMNRDAEAHLTISSPLEAHKQYTLCYAIVGIDVGYENPTFACLEYDYEDCDNDPTGEALKKTQQTLTFYELDLGLNHVVRKYAEPLSEPGNLLISVPGGNEGPSGVIVCCENYLVYKNLGDQPDIKCPIPRRRNDLDDPDRTLMIICQATHKTKSMYFFLVQTEQGDIFKVTLETDDDLVTEMKMKYFDTVPPANSMCILKSGFLFIAAEFGNHELYQISNLGDDEEDEFSSRMQLEDGETFFYGVRELKSLIHVDSIDSLSPLTDAIIGDVAHEDAAQVYALVGRGPRSKLKILRNGLEVTEMAVSDLPGVPSAVWTVKKNVDDKNDSYIVVSFVSATLVLTIGDTVEEAQDSGFLGTTTTLGCGLIGDDSLLQIYSEGIRHIRADKRVNEWKTPPKREIKKCAMNRRQVAIAMTGGEVVYFELDLNGTLNEFTERKLFNAEVACMSFSEISEGELNSRFLAIGTIDNAVRIISLDPNDMLMPLSTQNLPCAPESLLLVDTPNEDGKGLPTIHLNIGLQNGCLFRNTVDNVTGAIMDTRTRYLGTRPVKLFKMINQGKTAILCTSSRPWLLYHFQRRFHLTPLSYVHLEYAASFCSDQCPEGLVAISESTLRILATEKLGVSFNVQSFNHKLTPRKAVVHPNAPAIITIECDHAAYTETTKNMKRNEMAEDIERLANDQEEIELAKEIADGLRNTIPDETIYGAPKAAKGKWASAVTLRNVKSGEVMSYFELPQDESAKCIALVQFARHPESTMILVGCGVNENLHPYQAPPNPLRPLRGCVYTFLLSPGGERFDFWHRTETPLPVGAIHDFRGMALIGFGKYLRMYDIGQKKLLAKCENKVRLSLRDPIRFVSFVFVGMVNE
ncbi:unnamed protein product [Caenorhabditis bovis]|uniref:Cleavage/polyadenylation specificity factor A subunit N-terminal domain-containing protein n=1 Tax=Caenorhabditis bovis TaxID=2654633 RepID=A0A8S1F9U1_9PELO|nr:unnamed protein product [Caenorhabditis bovis]